MQPTCLVMAVSFCFINCDSDVERQIDFTGVRLIQEILKSKSVDVFTYKCEILPRDMTSNRVWKKKIERFMAKIRKVERSWKEDVNEKKHDRLVQIILM